MRFTFFYHSLVSDWNHGNAHFLRGVVSELQIRGHQVTIYEPANGWSKENLLLDHGQGALDDFHARYPLLDSIQYQRDSLDLEQVAAASDVVIVHEWNEPWLINALGELHESLQKGSNAQQSFRLLFHDTHHRAVSYPGWLKRLKLQYYDGILAFGEVLADVYRSHGWKNTVWTWHEAADIRVFFPREPNPDFPYGDLVWIGNWGDDERVRELQAFLFRPVKALNLDCHVYGVRYPDSVLRQLEKEQVRYGGWLPNFRVPDVFANHTVTVHVPRRYYNESLPGVPTIRPFEAMACGIPLVSAPWQDSERLFTAGEDYLVAHDGHEMQRHLHAILHDRDFAAHLAHHALVTIRQRHTCGHRVDQLLGILASLDSSFRTRFSLQVSSLTSRIGIKRQTVEGSMHA